MICYECRRKETINSAVACSECLLEIEKFRSKFPDYANLSDLDLITKFYTLSSTENIDSFIKLLLNENAFLERKDKLVTYIYEKYSVFGDISELYKVRALSTNKDLIEIYDIVINKINLSSAD